ncbi:MAG: hypothetical protein ACI9A1_000359 [Lentimonas sp.]|jgi:hypothetical protein
MFWRFVAHSFVHGLGTGALVDVNGRFILLSMLDALLFNVVDVEPSVNDFVCRDELRDIAVG